MPVAESVFFLPTPRGEVYGLHMHVADLPPRAGLLWLPPFAEEANCARRQLVAAARECRAEGYASLLIDPLGTGESDGDFADASLDQWYDNVMAAAAWFRQRLDAPLWLVGVRAGGLLAAHVAAALAPHGIVCWQPVSSGKDVLERFLRLRLGAEWALQASAKAAEVLGRLRDELAAGQSVEIAGYVLSPAMASSLTRCKLKWPLESCKRAACIEFRPRREYALTAGHSPAISRLCSAWRDSGLVVSSATIEAPTFWSSYESAVTPGLGTGMCRLMESFSS